MKRISKVVKKDNFVPEQGYLVFTDKGLIVYNGRIGLLYNRKKMGALLSGLVEKNGNFAVPDAAKFLRTIAALEDVSSAEIDKGRSCMVLKFNKAKGSLDIPVVLNLHEKIPHLDIKWKDYATDKEGGIPVSAVWREVTDLVTSEGEALWGDVIGIYARNNKLMSFDYGVYLEGKEEGAVADFFCPLAVLDLGINDLEYVKVDEDAVYMVGAEVQYVCTAISKKSVIDDMATLKEQFEKGDKKHVSLDLTSGVWKRAKVFADSMLLLSVKDGEIFISHENYKETIGKTAAPNAQFNTRISLLQRWASGSLDHSIAIGADGSWYLHGTTRSGLAFYAVLTDVQNPSKADKTGDMVPQKASEADIPVVGDTLL